MRRGVAAGATAVFLLLAALVLGGWDPLLRFDFEVSRDAHGTLVGSPWAADVARALTHLGHPVAVDVVAVLVAVALFRKRLRAAAVFVLVARFGTLALSSTVKLLVDRARPVLEDPVAQAHGASFPSGHASGATCTALALALVLIVRRPSAKWPLLGAAAVVAVVVAATRVLLGVHYPSDVVAGTALAVAWTVGWSHLLDAKDGPRLEDVPEPAA